METRKGVRGLCGTAIVVALALAALAPAAAARSKPKPKLPDLQFARAHIVGKSYGFTGETVTIRVNDTTENVGRAPARSASFNELTLHHQGADSLADLTRKVPPLGKDEVDTGIGKARIHIPSDAKPGAYKTRLCVDARDDVDEEDEVGNNCDPLGKFYIAKPSWSGPFAGRGSYNSINETWRTDQARFTFDENRSDGNRGKFAYTLAQAAVAYRDSGSDGHCTYSGSGLDTNPTGSLTVDYDANHYLGQATVPDSFLYPIIATCPEGTYVVGYGPVPGRISFATGQQAMPFGTETLSGPYTIPGSGNAYAWQLK